MTHRKRRLAQWGRAVLSALLFCLSAKVWIASPGFELSGPALLQLPGKAPHQVSFPFRDRLDEPVKHFAILLNWTRPTYGPEILHVTPDDCLVGLRINEKEVNLETIVASKDRCNWKKGFELNLKEYVNDGHNSLTFEIENKSGPYGLSISRSTKDPHYLFFRSIFWFLFLSGIFTAGLFLLEISRPTAILARWKILLERHHSKKAKLLELLIVVIVVACSYFTIFRGYADMPGPFWDENYHIPAAQKYLNGIYFMENHPPLGKLLIALGEKLLKANGRNDQFVKIDRLVPAAGAAALNGFSLKGYRLFPVLLGWVSAIVFYAILRIACGSALWALLFSTFFIFDNAITLHLRGAMLEGPQLCFFLMMLFQFLMICRAINNRRPILLRSIFLGVTFGLLVTTKITGVILILLVPAIWFKLVGNLKQNICFTTGFLTSFAVVFVTVWQIHFLLGKRVEPALRENGFYIASNRYKEYLAAGTTGRLSHFPVMLRDSFAFVGHYNDGVPGLKLGSPDEMGSTPSSWPFGGKSISYYRRGNAGELSRYLYLQANPLAWFCGLIGLILAAAYLLGSLFFPREAATRGTFEIRIFALLYAGYMIAMFNIARVMYLYHYFIPLILSWILLAQLVPECKYAGRYVLNWERKTAALFVLAISVIGTFMFFSPLTYFRPLSTDQFRSRVWLQSWQLNCRHCGSE